MCVAFLLVCVSRVSSDRVADPNPEEIFCANSALDPAS